MSSFKLVEIGIAILIINCMFVICGHQKFGGGLFTQVLPYGGWQAFKAILPTYMVEWLESMTF